MIQGAESKMKSASVNGIRSTEPPNMLVTVVKLKQTGFRKYKSAANTCNGPVRPRVRNNSGVAQHQIETISELSMLVTNNDMMEPTVESSIDPSITFEIFPVLLHKLQLIDSFSREISIGFLFGMSIL